MSPETPVPFEPELSEEVAMRRKGLKKGWTTGSCAAAAAKAAALSLVEGTRPSTIAITLPSSQIVSFRVEKPDSDDRIEKGQLGSAMVVKDGGDDPDCTHGAHINVHVSLNSTGKTVIAAGQGLGVVTLAGLGIPVGEPSITKVPRKMILEEVSSVCDKPLVITISVPAGIEMAEKTTNERLGIIGGISILGTTGIVKPFSTAAYRASVVQQIDVARAQGVKEMYLVTGHRSEKAAMAKFGEATSVQFVEVGDFTGVALKRSRAKGMTKVTVVAMAGKISKLADGVMMTHFHRTNVNTNLLLEAAKQTGASVVIVNSATETNTARHFAQTCIEENFRDPLEWLCKRAKVACEAFIGPEMEVDVIMVDFEGEEVIASA
ncbi:MAG: cobalt-precorrin-5B (C(1))-methyltransferase [Acidimicrobiales bacterium]|nr:cobalt-precorrin-5B (C(1))-methyltransferase [Acidimicrobiales bacterium]